MTKGGISIKIKKNIVKTLLHKNDKYHFINLYFFYKTKIIFHSDLDINWSIFAV